MVKNISTKLEKFFFAFLIINPFLDVISGVYINILEQLSGSGFDTISVPITPSLVVRMAVLLLFAFYALVTFDKTAIGTIIPIGVAWVMSVAGEILFFYAFNLFGDIQYIARFVYNLAVVLVYVQVFRNSGMSKQELMKKLTDVLCFSLLLLSLSIVLSYAIGVGYTTYADRYGSRGARGFFYSGNDITAILMAGLPLVLCSFMQSGLRGAKEYWGYAFSCALTSISLLLIGTKTAFIAVFAAVGVFAVCALYFWLGKKQRAMMVRLCVVVLLTIGVFGVLTLITGQSVFGDIRTSFMQTGDTLENEGAATALLSGRQNKLKYAYRMFREGGIFTYIFGVGRGTQSVIIEMDIFEVVIYYGLFGALVMLWLYAKLGFGFVWQFFKNMKGLGDDLMPLACLVSLGLCAAYLVAAGHMLFSVTSGFYFSFVLLYSKMLYTKDIKALKI